VEGGTIIAYFLSTSVQKQQEKGRQYANHVTQPPQNRRIAVGGRAMRENELNIKKEELERDPKGAASRERSGPTMEWSGGKAVTGLK